MSLDATEGVSEGGKGAPGGGNAFVEEDVQNKPGHPFINEGTIVAESGSSRWTDGMHIHSLANHGSLQGNLAAEDRERRILDQYRGDHDLAGWDPDHVQLHRVHQ